MAVTVSITLTDPQAARVAELLPAGVTVKQYIVGWLTHQVLNHEQAEAAQQAQAAITTITPT